MRRGLIVSCMTAATLALAAPAQAQFSLAGKTVTVTVAGGVGGGVDLYTRLLLIHMAQFLPGKPSMMVQNQPGGGGLQGVQNVYNLGAKDGTSMGVTPAGPIKEPLMGSSKVNYDLRKFRWVGSLTAEDTVCLVWNTSTIHNVEDTKKREVPLSATGAASNSTLGPLLLNDLLGTKFKPISGYDGGTSMLAVERGEVEGRCSTLSSVRTAQPNWIADKKIRVLFAVSSVDDDPDYRNVPKVHDMLKTEADRAAFDFFGAPDEIQDPLYLPPGTPDETLTAFRRAFDATMKDAAYRADIAKRAQRIVPRTGAEVEKTINAMYATPVEAIERVKRATALAASK